MESDGQTALPPGLDLLWGRRERGRKGPKPGLTLEAIVEQAIAIADAEGLSAVSMARVAKDLGFTTMSLYRYVDNKDELLQLMWNASSSGAPEIEGDDWRSKLRSWAIGQWTMLEARRWILELPIVTPPAGPQALAWIEQAMAALDGTGLSDAESMGVVGLLSSYTLGEGRMAYDAAVAAERGGQSYDYAAVLRAVAEEHTYPSIHRVAWSGEIDDPEGSGEEESYLFGLEVILDGIAARIERAERSS
ncbi:TetR/AcrR family transcriptional regulator [Solicola gregarius]|uniref:TetR/AcrR family transcriptional regulator n=1 Tax=Solicola gregarius TaxID=2908642 RepID=A0AA46YPL0_9ACTN|nr:TetR/AcrR family transcriptional regulator [Solicola gregarius]UYM07723.1 TetR/AcrR family transcriptional regulator [Solicola gregarius]